MDNKALKRRPTRSTAAESATEASGATPSLPLVEIQLPRTGVPDEPPGPIRDLERSSNFINRELSLLEFQCRVLDEARQAQNPLLERLRFLSIVGSNLDEFFMVRVAGLKEQVAAGVLDVSRDGLTPAEQLVEIRKRASRLMDDSRSCFSRELQPLLKKNGIHVTDYQDLKTKQKRKLKRLFEELVFPILTPLAHDPGRPFPFISNLSLNLAVLVRDKKGREHFARVKVPGTIPRLVPLTSTERGKSGRLPASITFTWMEQVIAAHLDALFPGMEVVESHPFRVTRSADMVIQELEAGDLLETVEVTVRRRQFGRVVRVAVSGGMPRHVREILMKNMELEKADLYTVDGPLGFSSLMAIASLEKPELRYPLFSPRAAAKHIRRDPGRRHLCRDSKARHSALSSLRLLCPSGRLSETGCQRSACPGH